MAKRGSEKREHPRVEARLAMQLAEETLGEALVTTESLNISRGGVYCESSEYLAPLSKVALTVILPALVKGGRTSMLRSEGVVVRCESLPAVRGRKRYQLACCFTSLDADGRAVLDQFVAWRALRGRAAALARAAAGAGALRKVVAGGRRKVVKRAKTAVRKKAAVKKAVAKKATRAVPKRAPAKKAARRSTPKKK
jgi:hypothetical protein